MCKGLKMINIVVLLLCMLTGCGNSFFSAMFVERDDSIEPSIDYISSEFSFAEKDGCFIYDKDGHVGFFDSKTETEYIDKLPKDRTIVEITSGEKFFYVLCTNEDVVPSPYYVRVYKGKDFLYEVSVPFQRVLAKNGYIFGYSKKVEGDFGIGSNISNSCIEAHYYIAEKDFTKGKAGNIKNWIKLEGDSELMVGDTKLYRYPNDNYPDVECYSDSKYVRRWYAFNYLLVCDGDLSSDEDDEEYDQWIDEFHKAMGSEEENFEAYFWVKDDKYYGICNVYNESGNMLRFRSKDIKYSFGFEVEDNTKHIKKISDHENIELIYENEDNLVYKINDKVYYKNKKDNKEKLVYTYGGKLEINILDGCFKFREVETYMDGNNGSDKKEKGKSGKDGEEYRDKIIKLF